MEMLDEGLAWSTPQHRQGVQSEMAINDVSRPRPGSTLEECVAETSEQRRIGSARADEALVEIGRANHNAFNPESSLAKRVSQVESVSIKATR
jgi:hypothetical protein